MLIEKTEWYPVFTISEYGDYPVNLTPAELARVQAAFKEFAACQRLLAAKVQGAKAP